MTTPKITTLDRTVLRRINAEVDAAVAAVAEKYGLSIRTRGFRFSPASADVKLEIATVGGNGAVMSREAEDFKLYAAMYGMKADDLGRTVRLRGEDYEVAGIKPRSTRFPVLVRRKADGKMFKYADHAVCAALAAAQGGAVGNAA